MIPTRFLHLWLSLMTLHTCRVINDHVTRKPWRSSVNIVHQAFCGLPLGLLSSPGVQFMAILAGLSSIHLSTWLVSFILLAFTILDRGFITDLISSSLPPPKKEVMFLIWSVCLSVCRSVRRITRKLVGRILTKFFVGVGHGSRTKWYNFGGDLDHASDPGVQSPKSGSSGLLTNCVMRCLAEVCTLWVYLVTHVSSPWYSQYFPNTSPTENVQSVMDLCYRSSCFTCMKCSQ